MNASGANKPPSHNGDRAQSWRSIRTLVIYHTCVHTSMSSIAWCKVRAVSKTALNLTHMSTYYRTWFSCFARKPKSSIQIDDSTLATGYLQSIETKYAKENL